MKTNTAQIDDSLIQKVEGAYSIVNTDMNMPLNDEETYPEFGEDNTYGSNDERAGRGYRRLRQEVVTRWNSVLEMISSLLTLTDEVCEAVKCTGNFDLIVEAVDWNILHELCKVLVSFKSIPMLRAAPSLGCRSSHLSVQKLQLHVVHVMLIVGILLS